MSPNPRLLRVADRIQVELSEIIQRRLKDPRRGFITITGVDVTPDLRQARVFVSSLDAGELDAQLEMLHRASGFLRSELGRRLTLRHTPELQFKADISAERGRRVEELLHKLEESGGVLPADERDDDLEDDLEDDFEDDLGDDSGDEVDPEDAGAGDSPGEDGGETPR